MRTFVLLSTALLTAATASPHAATIPSSATVLRDGGGSLPGSVLGESSGESRIDSVAVASGFRPLRESSLPIGSRELRIWLIGGIAIPEDLYRIRIDHGEVTGQWIRYWERKGRFEQPSDVSQGAMMRYDFDGSCDRIGTAGNVDACITRFTKSPDWKSLLRRIEGDSVWTLRDQSEMPQDGILVLDGRTIFVETRDGANYRNYEYSDPESHANAGAQHAAAIAASLRTLWRLAAPSRQRKVYRGRFTSGDGPNALAVCGDTTKWGLTGEIWPLGPRRRDGTLDSLSDTIRVAYVEVRGTKAYPGLAKQWDSPYPEVIEADSVLLVRRWRAAACR